MTKKYILKKDLPDADAGTLLTRSDDGVNYDYPSKRCFDSDTQLSWYRKEFVENNPEWFEEVIEPERIEVNVFPTGGTDCKNGMWAYTYAASSPISQDKFHAIKAAIEDVLNSTTHICKHCNAEVNTPDEDCYKAPSKEKDTPSRDWEVLAYKHKVLSNELDKGIIVDKTSKHFEYAYGAPNDFEIHSVRRLSDNTVWTVGEQTKHGYIKGMKVGVNDRGNTDMSQIYVSITSDKELLYLCAGGPLSDLKKLPPKPQPLFVTHDGKEIWHFANMVWIVNSTWVVFERTAQFYLDKKGTEDERYFKYFSTKEVADEYVLMNKPCLSLGDAANVFGGSLTCKNVEDLRNLVKSKQ